MQSVLKTIYMTDEVFGKSCFLGSGLNMPLTGFQTFPSPHLACTSNASDTEGTLLASWIMVLESALSEFPCVTSWHLEFSSRACFSMKNKYKCIDNFQCYFLKTRDCLPLSSMVKMKNHLAGQLYYWYCSKIR